MPTFVVCTIADQAFGFPVEAVEEIVRMPWVTRVSESPADVRGVVDFRGVVVAVVDPALRLVGKPSHTRTDGFLILLGTSSERVAMTIDGVEGLVEGTPRVPPHAAEGPPFVAGHLGGDGDLVTILDVAALLRPDVRDFLRRTQVAGAGAPTT